MGLVISKIQLLKPNWLSYFKNTAFFLKVGGARGQVGVAKLCPKFSWLEVGLHAKFRPSGPSSFWDTACFVLFFYYFFSGRGQKKAPSSKAL